MKPGLVIGHQDVAPYNAAVLDGDRHAFGTAIVQRARRQATAMREMAEAGDRAAIALRPVAGYIEQAASDVEALPDDFWVA
jgi:hypothetical protein